MFARRWDVIGYRTRALLRKELNQIVRDRRVLVSMTLPLVMHLMLFGSILSPKVANLRLGVVDESQSPESRELIAELSESRSFQLAGVYPSVDRVGNAISRGDLDAGVELPLDFARDLHRGRATGVQILLNAMNANTATISRAYIEGVIESYNQEVARRLPRTLAIRATAIGRSGRVVVHPTFFYNPGLVTSWFVVTGLIGMLLIMIGSITASTTMVKEREAGTLEQLLMTPATTGEIIVGKIGPPFVLLCLMTAVALSIIRFFWQVPFHGGLLLVTGASVLSLLTGMGIGTFIATFTKSAQQAQLATFFLTPPLSALSGAFTPAEAMPHWLQPFTIVNPIYHFGVITRATLIKGSGLGTLWPHLVALAIFALVLMWSSVWRFRQQLG